MENNRKSVITNNFRQTAAAKARSRWNPRGTPKVLLGMLAGMIGGIPRGDGGGAWQHQNRDPCEETVPELGYIW